MYVGIADKSLWRRYNIISLYIYTHNYNTEFVPGITGNHAMQCRVASGTNKEVKGLKQRLGMVVLSVGGNMA